MIIQYNFIMNLLEIGIGSLLVLLFFPCFYSICLVMINQMVVAVTK